MTEIEKKTTRSILRPILVASTLPGLLLAGCTESKEKLASPNGGIAVEFHLADGHRPEYSLFHNDRPVLTESRLGLVMDGVDFSSNMEWLGSTPSTRARKIEESYRLAHGKQSEHFYEAREKTVRLRHSSGREMHIVFRVSDDGLGFRYHFPDDGESGEPRNIDEERTAYRFPESERTRAWLTPLADVNTGWSETNPSYEEHYFEDVEVGFPERPEPAGGGWAYPALFRVDESWVLVTEAGLDRNYCGTRLRNLDDGSGYRVGFPQDEEVTTGGIRGPRSTLPWTTPWRVVAVGDLGTVVESTLGTDLAAPNALEDDSFVRPGRASWSWAKLKDDSVVYDVQEAFIDYAADMNWEYTLVDVNWDRNIGYDRIAELAEYAESRGVGLLLWYNSSGDWNSTPYTPKSQLLTREQRRDEFARIADMGIKGVKVDFFPGDGQSAIEYYLDLFEDAAEFGLMVNTHGCTLPRGWHRTYPNLVTMESVKGFEFITFEQENADRAPAHGVMQPFTRNVFGPMDYTPVSLHDIPNIEQRTTNAYELATAVVFYSGIQHFAETPDGMEHAPAFARDFLREVPATWDETRFIKGFPGELAVIARRAGDTWYVGGMNGEATAKTLRVDLSGLNDAGSGYLISDGEDLRDLTRTEIAVDPDEPFTVDVNANGGFVFVLR